MDGVEQKALQYSLAEADYNIRETYDDLEGLLFADEGGSNKEFLREVHENCPSVLLVLEGLRELRNKIERARKQVADA